MTFVERTGFEALKRAIGDDRASRVSYFYRDRIQPAAEALTYRLDPKGRRSRRRLEAMRDRYAGERCFIIGNGPSLAKTDLSALRSEYTFGLNRGYLLFDRIGAPTTFLVAVNRYVAEQFGADLMAAASITFMSWRSRRLLRGTDEAIFVRRSRPFTFSRDIAAHGAWEGATVTFVAMQLAHHLGFHDVILVGVDHAFSTEGPANTLVTASESDTNHFDPNYFGPGVRWQLPDLATSEVAYRLAKQEYEATGRIIRDATVDGKLTVFPKVAFESLFGGFAERNDPLGDRTDRSSRPSSRHEGGGSHRS